MNANPPPVGRLRRVTRTTRDVLDVLLQVYDEQRAAGRPPAPVYGLKIAEYRAHLLPGSIYPVLQRLADAGWVTQEWEDVDPVEQARPRRRLYRLTDEGATAARTALQRSGRLRRGVAPQPRTAESG